MSRWMYQIYTQLLTEGYIHCWFEVFFIVSDNHVESCRISPDFSFETTTSSSSFCVFNSVGTACVYNPGVTACVMWQVCLIQCVRVYVARIVMLKGGWGVKMLPAAILIELDINSIP